VVIFGIDDGEFVFSQGYFSEGISESDATIYEQKGGEVFFEEFCDGKNNLFDFPCRLSIYINRPPTIARVITFDAKKGVEIRRPIFVTRSGKRR
jgi:hypothetical protein